VSLKKLELVLSNKEILEGNRDRKSVLSLLLSLIIIKSFHCHLNCIFYGFKIYYAYYVYSLYYLKENNLKK